MFYISVGIFKYSPTLTNPLTPTIISTNTCHLHPTYVIS